MVKPEVIYSPAFKKKCVKMKHTSMKSSLEGLIKKIKDKPGRNKTMRDDRSGTQEVYMGSYRISYFYNIKDSVIIFLSIYHKDEQ